MAVAFAHLWADRLNMVAELEELTADVRTIAGEVSLDALVNWQDRQELARADLLQRLDRAPPVRCTLQHEHRVRSLTCPHGPDLSGVTLAA